MKTPNRISQARRRSALLLLAGFAAATAAAAPARSQDTWAPGARMTQALTRLTTAVRKSTGAAGYGLDETSACFMGAYLAEGGSASITVMLRAGESYALIGGGDDGTRDLDVFVTDQGGATVARDVATDASPVVEFQPSSSGSYRLVLKLVRSTDLGSYCALAKLRKGGFDVPAANLSTAASDCIAAARAVAGSKPSSDFHRGDGQWFLIGGLLAQGETLTHRGVRLTGGHGLVAAADRNSQDVNVRVTGAADRLILADVAPESRPRLLFHATETAAVRVTNASSTGTALVMAALLDLPE